MLDVEVVRRELESLRTHGGIEQERLRPCEALRSLPVVVQHAETCRFETDVAAYDVILCAVERAIGRPDMKAILRFTLNIPGGWGDKLEDRRKNVKAVLALGEKSENAYLDREKRAYLELASILVRARVSPCDLPLRDQEFEIDDSSVVELRVSVPAGAIRILLGLLLTQPDIRTAFAMVDAIEERVPLLVDEIGELPGFNLAILLERTREFMVDPLYEDRLRTAGLRPSGDAPEPKILDELVDLLGYGVLTDGRAALTVGLDRLSAFYGVSHWASLNLMLLALDQIAELWALLDNDEYRYLLFSDGQEVRT